MPCHSRRPPVYTGPHEFDGQRRREIVERQPGVIIDPTSQPLPPENGLTVLASWQKGVVIAPTSTQGSTSGGSRIICRRQSPASGLARHPRVLFVCMAAGRPWPARRHGYSVVCAA